MISLCKFINRFTVVNHYSLRLRNISTNGKSVRIGCASGFWGDSAVSTPQLLQKGDLDFLVYDYLSEITMSLMTAVKAKLPKMGYAPDFVQIAMAPHLKLIQDNNVKVISNAGGVNPFACASALQKITQDLGLDLKIATITGDDILHMKNDFLSDRNVKDMQSGLDFPNSVNSMNVYAGASAISEALDLGADIIITGRCVDSALALGPLLHHFKWPLDSYDLLASGSLAGHLIECGAQATGGVYTDWASISGWENIGFPIVECFNDGKIILTKPIRTGGSVTVGTASEQMLYEIDDPCNYYLPDVTCDFSQVRIDNIEGRENEAVMITNAKGKPPSKHYKVCATYFDGYRCTAVAPIVGSFAVDKGKKTANAILNRVKNIFKMLKLPNFSAEEIYCLGSEESYGSKARKLDVKEAVMWISVAHREKKALEIFSREVAPAGTGMAPGLTGLAGGRPKVSPILKLFSFMINKNEIQFEININGECHKHDIFDNFNDESKDLPRASNACHATETLVVGDYTFKLQDLAFARSGDKGNNANIGVIARHPSYMPYLKNILTPECVEKYFEHLWSAGYQGKRVIRYEVPGIHGFNFVLINSLGGGGVASLRPDPQGKAYAQIMLDMELSDLPNLLLNAEK